VSRGGPRSKSAYAQGYGVAEARRRRDAPLIGPAERLTAAAAVFRQSLGADHIARPCMRQGRCSG